MCAHQFALTRCPQHAHIRPGTVNKICANSFSMPFNGESWEIKRREHDENELFFFLKSRSLVGVRVREMVNVVNSSIHEALQLCQWHPPIVGFHFKLQVWPGSTIYLLIPAYFMEIWAGAIGIHHVRRALSGFIYWLYTNLYMWLCWRCIQHDTGDEIQLSYWTVCLFPVKLLSFNETQHSKWCIIAANICFLQVISFFFSPCLCVVSFLTLPVIVFACLSEITWSAVTCISFSVLVHSKGFKNKNKGILPALCGYRPICNCKKSASPMRTK